MPRISRVSPPVSPPLRVRLQMHRLERGLSQLGPADTDPSAPCATPDGPRPPADGPDSDPVPQPRRGARERHAPDFYVP